MTDIEVLQGGEVVDLVDEGRRRIAARIGGVQPVRVGEHDQAVSPDQHGDLGGEEVVVPEGDLVCRRRVVLVDHRHDAPVQELAQGPAGVEVVRARADVEEREQHLGAAHAPRAQQLVEDRVELALADRARRLQLVDRPGAQRQLQYTHPARDGPARDDHQVLAGSVKVGGLTADRPQDVLPHLAVVAGHDARAEFDHRRAHRGNELRRRGARKA